MTDVAIRVENLGKRYEIGAARQNRGRFRYKSVRDSIANIAAVPFRRARALLEAHRNGTDAEETTIWALKDVSFEVKRGEVVGVIGRNGAGKSTLLKVLSRITEPSQGRVEICGRVGSLLEVGTGFHPELTGRDNVYLNGAILGMRHREIDRHFDAIVHFAEIERFIDTPVKHYSSGMYLRLAFAVAAHLEPEILLIDEVLAVGDAAFQRKCLGKMGEVAREGRTVLFVSHNIQAISALTRRCALMSSGRCEAIDATDLIVTKYLAEGSTGDLSYVDFPNSSTPIITRVEVKTSRPLNYHLFGEPLDVCFEVVTPVALRAAALSFQIYDHLKQPILHLLTLDAELPMCRQAGRFCLTCRIPKCRLYIGRFTLTVYLSAARERLQKLEDICPFEVIHDEVREHYWQSGAAAYVEDCEWMLERQSTTETAKSRKECVARGTG
ncbi:MAG: ABC transporter ATP-binding protein [Bryobacteraceae bacterium]|jgi:ABC-type polysaccharide/polyol phosphate transport system ATPase subunit